MTTPYLIKGAYGDKNQVLADFMDVTTGHHHDGVDSAVVAYRTVVAGIYSYDAAGGTTVAVAVASIVATDIVLAQFAATATAAYVLSYAITAGTGFAITSSAAIGKATLSYCVLKNS